MSLQRQRACATGGIAAGVLFLLPRTACAHLATTGLGPVYDGVYHLTLSPRQTLPMAALALFAGLRGPAQSRAVCLWLPLAWLAAGLFAPSVGAGTAALACALTALGTGALLASGAPLPIWATGGLACLCGAVLGGCYDGPTGVGPVAGGLALVGVLLALLTSVSLPLRRLQAVIAVRVAGSWTAALGLLLVGWWVHGRGL